MADTCKLERWSVLIMHFYKQAKEGSTKLVEVDLKILLGFVHQLGQLRNSWIGVVGRGIQQDWTIGIEKESDPYSQDLVENMMLVEELYSKCEIIEEYLRKMYPSLMQIFKFRPLHQRGPHPLPPTQR